jgi:drug/metabolite transporter (DMT)-like permease
MPATPFLGVLLAFGAVYVIWGSTYLAIKVVVEALPPLFVAGLRCVIAGTILYAWARLRGVRAPTGQELRRGLAAGLLLFLGAHGALYTAIQHVPSGLAAILFATIPIWVALFVGAGPEGGPPQVGTILGLALGLAGIAWLNVPSVGSVPAPWFSVLVLAGAASWAAGMVWYRGPRRPPSEALSSALPLLGGGGALLALSAFRGELASVAATGMDATALWCLAYLVVFGSLVTFSAYTWLLGRVSPTRVASYAYVNPLVALFLGWLLAGEELTPGMIAPVVMILVSVALVVSSQTQFKETDDATPNLVREGIRARYPPGGPRRHRGAAQGNAGSADRADDALRGSQAHQEGRGRLVRPGARGAPRRPRVAVGGAAR